ncbi:MAG: sugar nucleotide-binding protein, partial [Spirochaetota bacterium]
RDFLNVVGDQKGTPTWAYDLACAIIDIIAAESSEYGIYHFTNEGETNWHEFALAIRDTALSLGLLSKSIPVNPVSSEQYPTKALRPAYSILDKTRIKKLLKRDIPEWKNSLALFLEDKAKK